MKIGNYLKKIWLKIWQLSLWKKAVIILLIAGLSFWLVQNQLNKSSNTPTYQTQTAEKGTLVTSISSSGTISSANNVSITSNATGVISTVYVKNGDAVIQGQKIAEITLDQDSTQKQASAWSSYLSAINQQQSSNRAKLTADASMWSTQQQVLSAQIAVDDKNLGGQNDATKADYTQLEKENVDTALIQARKSFTAAEKAYLEAGTAIQAANASVSSAWLAYQQVSNTIIAPTSGTVSNLSITQGTVISSSSTDSSQTSTQKVGTVTLSSGKLQAAVNLSEVDVTKVKAGQKVTMTMDAFPTKTFTGTVSSVDTNGSASSGVTTYPAIIMFDLNDENIYPNMAIAATIITSTKSDVVLIPSAAVMTQDGVSFIQVMESGAPVSKTVEVGSSNDTQTEIVAGLNEGETVITSSGSSAATTATQNGTTPFGNTFGGNRGFGGTGGTTRIQTR